MSATSIATLVDGTDNADLLEAVLNGVQSALADYHLDRAAYITQRVNQMLGL